MNESLRLLVIGDADVRDAVAHSCTECEIQTADDYLAGLWEAGQATYDALLVQVKSTDRLASAVRNLRAITSARIILTCGLAEEPVARGVLQHGADDYLLEPFDSAALTQALQRNGAPSPAVPEAEPPTALRPNPFTHTNGNGALSDRRLEATPGDVPPPAARGHTMIQTAARHAEPAPPEPSLEEVQGLVAVLQQLGEGPQATLDRLAELVRRALAAQQVLIDADGCIAGAGAAPDGVPHTEKVELFRQRAPIGQMVVSLDGLSDERAAKRVKEYARLVEVVLQQAIDRQQWRDLAWTDDVTRLRNRRYFERSLEELLQRAREQRSTLTVVLFDIDGFKKYNDRFGHATGDALIREVAQLLLRCSRENDVVARFGGDEFAVILWDAEAPRVPGSHHPRQAGDLADRFCRAINDHRFSCLGRDAPGAVTISGGLATFPWDALEPAALLNAADQALLVAKRTGKNRLVLSDACSAASDS